MKKLVKIIVLLLIGVLFVACGKKNSIDDKILVVGASVAPHAEILEQARAYIESKGYELKIVEFTDYIQPNVGVWDDSLDANFFQHLPYLEQYNADNKTKLVSVHAVHFEPLAIYAGKNKSIDLKEGASIGVPIDTSNGARALLLLDQLGLIKVNKEKGLKATKLDIIENKLKLNIVEFEAAIIPSKLQELDIAVINGNVALTAKITDKLILNTSEDKLSLGAETYANIISVKEGNEDKEAIKVLIEALKQPNIIEFINKTYNGLVIPLAK